MTTRADILDQLRARYREPQRHYHTLEHVGELLALLEAFAGELARRDRVEWAVWFHDAVYDPTRPDNEAQSAALAEGLLTQHGLPDDDVAAVVALVLATAGHQWRDGQRDTALFLDLDLSILGAAPARYDAYLVQVRAEYAFVPEDRFRSKRAELVRSWLAREALYFTDVGRARFEQQARANLTRELVLLAG